MPKSLNEYADWLAGRDHIWPAPPDVVDAKATPYTKPLKGIRAVTWSVYGTLLRVSQGELLFDHPEKSQTQVALEKVINEFNMWPSMHRAPGQPWEVLYDQYSRLLERQQMAETKRGDYPEIDSSRIWRELFRRLGEKEYDYDMEFYGDPEELSDKVSYFFHASLQGVEANPHALEALKMIADSEIEQTLLSDAQSFTLVQLLRALKAQGSLPPLSELFALDCLTLSFQEGVRKPSKSLYKRCIDRIREHGIGPRDVLHIGCNLRDDLAVAKQMGMKTALYAADKSSLKAGKEDMKDPDAKPDRLLTDLGQLRDVLSLG